MENDGEAKLENSHQMKDGNKLHMCYLFYTCQKFLILVQMACEQCLNVFQGSIVLDL